MINAKLSVDADHNCDQKPDESCFSNLKLVYFFLVQYVTRETRDPGSRPVPEPLRNQNVGVRMSSTPMPAGAEGVDRVSGMAADRSVERWRVT